MPESEGSKGSPCFPILEEEMIVLRRLIGETMEDGRGFRSHLIEFVESISGSPKEVAQAIVDKYFTLSTRRCDTAILQHFQVADGREQQAIYILRELKRIHASVDAARRDFARVEDQVDHAVELAEHLRKSWEIGR